MSRILLHLSYLSCLATLSNGLSTALHSLSVELNLRPPHCQHGECHSEFLSRHTEDRDATFWPMVSDVSTNGVTSLQVNSANWTCLWHFVDHVLLNLVIILHIGKWCRCHVAQFSPLGENTLAFSGPALRPIVTPLRPDSSMVRVFSVWRWSLMPRFAPFLWNVFHNFGHGSPILPRDFSAWDANPHCSPFWRSVNVVALPMTILLICGELRAVLI